MCVQCMYIILINGTTPESHGGKPERKEDDMVYAMIDWTAKKSNPGYGFANAKKAIAFSSAAKRDEYLADRSIYDLSACKITRKKAMTMLERYPDGSRVLPLDCEDFMDSCVEMR